MEHLRRTTGIAALAISMVLTTVQPSFAQAQIDATGSAVNAALAVIDTGPAITGGLVQPGEGGVTPTGGIWANAGTERITLEPVGAGPTQPAAGLPLLGPRPPA
jgi:hypothetical protein